MPGTALSTSFIFHWYRKLIPKKAFETVLWLCLLYRCGSWVVSFIVYSSALFKSFTMRQFPRVTCKKEFRIRGIKYTWDRNGSNVDWPPTIRLPCERPHLNVRTSPSRRRSRSQFNRWGTGCSERWHHFPRSHSQEVPKCLGLDFKARVLLCQLDTWWG